MQKDDKIPKWQIIVPFLLQTIAWYPVRGILKFFVNLEIEGKDFVKEAFAKARKEKRSVLFISNHLSELDPILSTMATNPFVRGAFPYFWVARPGDTYKNDPDFSWRRYIYGKLFFLSWGAQPADLGVKDYAKSLWRHEYLLKKGYTVCIYPQGGIGKKQIRGGAGYLMESANPIVIAIKIDGAEGITQKDFFSRKRKIVLKFSRPYEPEELLYNSLEVPDRYKKAVEKIFNERCV